MNKKAIQWLREVVECIEGEMMDLEDEDRGITLALVASDGFMYRRLPGKKTIWISSDGAIMKGSMSKMLRNYVIGEEHLEKLWTKNRRSDTIALEYTTRIHK